MSETEKRDEEAVQEEEEYHGRYTQTKLEEALEIKSLRRIISAYLNYADAAEEDVRRYERSFQKLPPSHKALLSHLPLKYQALRRCICVNSYFILSMLQVQIKNCSESSPSSPAAPEYKIEAIESGEPAACNGNVTSPCNWLDPSFQLKVPLVDVDKVRCVIRNIVRDWASEGQREREQCYTPILEELDRLFPDRCKESPPCCLVPGAGLGRLALEISCRGFISQGNEFSYYMMICSSFILNHTQSVGEWTIYPWIHSNSNSLADSDQLRPVTIPDILPAGAGITEGFSMCGGDFVEVYSDPLQEGVWDAVVTCFFIDTAHNIVEYIEIISRLLKDGGVWINLGPLLYHFADMYGQEDEMSIELSLEDVKRVALHYGFQMEKEKTIETTYTTNPRSMMQNRYYAAFWTMRKKARQR
ncbi:Carnosine N-methyltransferase [Dillenia turbinata]|uniref:carnosine N-methyltransferase n=1 Tax=Dillenia turbinata TaxID=194707 RepID=A0AAN8YZK4_9MAGN